MMRPDGLSFLATYILAPRGEAETEMQMQKAASAYALTRAARDDVAAIIDVHLASNRMFAGTGLLPDSELVNAVPAQVVEQSVGDGLVFVIRHHGDGVVAFAMCHLVEETLYLDQISVIPAHGRKGLGRRLVQRVLREAADLRLSTVTLSTFRDLAWNGPFYRKLGFREIPRRQLSEFMKELEAAQATTMDVSLRCFMRRRVRRILP